MAYPDTEDALEELAILPDWAAGVTASFTYRNSTIKTLSGYVQTVRHFARCRNRLSYIRNTEGKADNEKLSFNRVAQANRPIKVPMWGHGVTLRIAQTSNTQIDLSIGITDEMEVGERIFLYDPVTGGSWRYVISIEDFRRRLILLQDFGEPNFPQGAWVFPTMVGTISIAESGRMHTQAQASIEKVTFTEL